VVNTIGLDITFLPHVGMDMTNIRKLLGANIRAYRRDLGISQEEFATMVGMATNYLGRIEGGKKFPSADIIERIAVALGKDPTTLFALGPIQQGWKEDLLLKINTLIDQELADLVSMHGEAEKRD